MTIKSLLLTFGVGIIFSTSSLAVAQNVEYKPVLSEETGKVSHYLSLPKSWRVHHPSNDVVISSPDGAKVYKSEVHSFFYGPGFDHQQQAVAGRYPAEPVSVEQYFQHVIVPNMERGGAELISTYPLPVFADFFQQASDSIPNLRSQVSHYAIGSDWKTQNGTKIMLASIARYAQQSSALTWDVIIGQMEAPEHSFESSKDILLFGVQNAKLGQENIQAVTEGLNSFYRQNDAKWKAIGDQSLLDHQRRMNEIAAIGAVARQQGQANLDRLDSNHQSWQRNEARRWAGQADTIRTIRGETVIGSPNSNSGYTVQDGYDNYWVNQSGDYIPSNDGFYDPNQDDSVNSQTWTQAEEWP